MKKILFFKVLISLLVSFAYHKDETIITYSINLEKDNLQLFWKDDKGKIIGNFSNLKKFVKTKKETLKFAMNGGMYEADFAPVGLYIENGTEQKKINLGSGNGNFHMKPNGIFYTTKDKKAFVCKTEDFVASKNVKYATQSGPMLVIDGKIHPDFVKDSKNVNIRNGVGILPNGDIVFAISKEKVNFYDFAQYFQDLDCQNALYLDGFVSKAYFKDKSNENQGEAFGVMIAVLE